MARNSKLLLAAAALSGAVLLAQEGHAEAITPTPGQAIPVALGNVRGVAYFSVQPDGGFRVVTTINVGDEAMSVRAIVTLQPGQATSISVPGLPGMPPAEVSFQRRGEQLVVGELRQQAAALR
jgi:hypothetical protein